MVTGLKFMHPLCPISPGTFRKASQQGALVLFCRWGRIRGTQQRVHASCMPSVEAEQGEPWRQPARARGELREVLGRAAACSGERVGTGGALQRTPEGTESVVGERRQWPQGLDGPGGGVISGVLLFPKACTGGSLTWT